MKNKNKRYYWIRLKTDFFEQETIDFLMSQKNGCQYIVLYQMLCLKTANSNGELSNKIGERIVPFDINKIVRDTKYFDFDTVTVALELFKQLGLIYYQPDNNTLQIANYENMVGSESESAHRVRKFRAERALQCNNNVTVEALQCNQEIRDKSIEYRDIEIDIDNTTTAQEKNLSFLNKKISEIDWSEYSEKQRTELYFLNPEYGVTTAEYLELYKMIIENALLRYFVKVQDYETDSPFRTILQWAYLDGNLIAA